jgi:hypothetical protein
MIIYKLRYIDEETAIEDFISKGVIETADGEQWYIGGTQAVVNIGKIIEFPATYDNEGNIITEPIYYSGIFYDIMSTSIIDFGTNRIFPVESVHGFLGYDPNADGPVGEDVIT